MTAPLSVGVLGCGGIAQMMHLPTLAERPDLFKISALADRSQETLDLVANRYAVDFRTTNGLDLAARSDLDAILILNSGSHMDAVVAMLDAKKHVFCEKPLGMGTAELDPIQRAATSAPGALMIGYHKRFDPSYLRARQAVREMKSLRFVQVTVLHPDDDAYRTHHPILPLRSFSPTPEAEMNQSMHDMIEGAPFADLLRPIVGGDAPAGKRMATFLLYDSLLHDLNAVRGILGDPEEVLSASYWNDGFAQTSLSRMAGGARASMSWMSLPGLKHYEESLLFVGPQSRVKLVFPSPYLRHAPTALTIERMDGDTLVEEHHTVSYEEAFRSELHHFHRMVLEEQRPAEPLEDAIADAAWIQQIANAY